MAKTASEVLNETMGKPLKLYSFGMELTKLRRQASNNPQTAPFLKEYDKKIGEYAQGFMDLNANIASLSINIKENVQKSIDQVSDFGQFLCTKPEGSKESIFQIIIVF